MTTTHLQPPNIKPSDRLSLTLSLAIIIHAIIILGITFTLEDDLQPRFETMEVILVLEESDAEDDAKILAQKNLSGGWDMTEHKQTTNLPSPIPEPISEPIDGEKPMLDGGQKTFENLDVGKEQQSAQMEKTVIAVDEENAQTPYLSEEISSELDTQRADNLKTENLEEYIPKPKIKKPSLINLLKNERTIASMLANLEEKIERKEKAPRERFISANTKEYHYAEYMETWRQRIQNIGNLNYPKKARVENIEGTLILDVGINSDGSIRKILIVRSSGKKILDDAAVRIVKLAIPFEPLSPNIRKETDILHIIRTWQFGQGGFVGSIK